MIKAHAAGHDDDHRPADAAAPLRQQTTIARTLLVALVWLAIWFVPIAVLAVIFGPESIYVTQGTFFSQAAVVTFGGAYAVLPYISQQAVEHYKWLSPTEMLDGLGMAETTPGPLIMVVQFVGFLGAYRNPGDLPPLAAGVLGSVITVWATFAPCFLYIFVGAPYIERLRANKSLSCALSAITAAVVGVVLNLAIWFAIHVLFGKPGETHYAPLHVRWFQPDWTSVSWPSVIIALVAAGVLFGTKRGMFGALAVGAVGGLAWFVIKQVLSTQY